jgi:hypothetical protein
VGFQGALTVPELLLIFEAIRHLKCHLCIAGQVLKSSSRSSRHKDNEGPGACVGGREVVRVHSSVAASASLVSSELADNLRQTSCQGKNDPWTYTSTHGNGETQICHRNLME